ncbi:MULTISPECIES: pantoate--beta-alanine ligase [Pelosinus]|uniref:Pantothenate synthetase n=1 Tax=Pelosinus fermentans B4 TaxID=1149862 RepID=I9B1Z7_9FIRM|nr:MULTISPECIES: pantoate--beta-alanine ligase [Pelosinus]EIW19172.1 pantoate/beta-alanine ligase [Pelosinus fermentans B4]EIW25096.1 Pantothenate synthetase [Pelosinus fermentans A11]OAM96153.1 Pantothenate synthetase [Pelosinus fermentans DSM 17108]SDR36927.1 pantothenate synthetase [Pelosinus fermentans]
MRIIETIEEMKIFVKQVKARGLSIGLVPTMGSLHEGHLTLMRQAKEQSDIVVVSIFVNPTQFGPNEDYTKYPRDLTGDSVQAGTAGVDVIFHPQAQEMYPKGYSSFIEIDGITQKLCGLSRPGHFRGVATVVTKLFNVIQPDIAFFGQKDAQQVLVLQRMASDLNMNIVIEIVPIVREKDGLAMSSRNAFLSVEERRAALVLSSSLQLAKQLVTSGEINVEAIRQQVIASIQLEELAQIDYVEIHSYPLLETIDQIIGKTLLALAVRIGNTRLIDNIILEG